MIKTLIIKKVWIDKRSCLECVPDNVGDVRLKDVYKTSEGHTYEVETIEVNHKGIIIKLHYLGYYASDVKSLKDIRNWITKEITLVDEEEAKKARRNSCLC